MAEQYRALLIGNSRYHADPHNLQRLVGPVNDIHLLRAVLEDEKVGMFRPGTVTLCSDYTTKEILHELETFFGNATRDEVLLLYYSGHGRLDLSATLYLCAFDTVAQELISTAVSSRQISDFIEHSSAARTIIILDCCHSGAFKSGDIARPLSGLGRYVLTSCRASELANDASEANKASMFTEHLVAGIRRARPKPAADHLTIEELHEYVRDRLDEQGRQRPQYNGAGQLGLAIARRPPSSSPSGSSVRVEGLAVSETLVEVREVTLDEVLPVERIYVTARRPDGMRARWTATASADWVGLKQCADPDRLELTITPRAGGTRANVEIRNEETGDVRTVRLVLSVTTGRTREAKEDRRDPPATATQVADTQIADTAAMVAQGNVAEQQGDVDEAERWYQRAVDAGDAEAMNRLAILLYERRHNVADATRWFRQAADNGRTDAMVSLGVLALDQENFDEAELWFRRAAQAGNSEAMVALGYFSQGREDADEARRWFQQAAEDGNVEAFFGLGCLAHEQQDDAEAKRWLTRAAEAGHSDSMVELGWLALKRGKVDKAERWFRQAAAAENTNGTVGLGAVAQHRSDFATADRWFRKAAGEGNTSGMVHLGLIARNQGRDDEAEQWFRTAADSGDTDAMAHLAELLQGQDREIEAEQWLGTAADAGDTDAMDRLAAQIREDMPNTVHPRWEVDPDYPEDGAAYELRYPYDEIY